MGIVSGLLVGTIAAATLLTEQGGLDLGFLTSIAEANTEYAGYLLAGLFAVIGVSAWLLWRRAKPAL